MVYFVKLWRRLKQDTKAVTALEYALIGGVIVATVGVGFAVLTTDLATKFGAIGTAL